MLNSKYFNQEKIPEEVIFNNNKNKNKIKLSIQIIFSFKLCKNWWVIIKNGITNWFLNMILIILLIDVKNLAHYQ